MAKFKHNKKKNSAFLYEVLVQELTKAVISKNLELRESLTSLIKEFYSRDSMMYQELKLYQAIINTKSVDTVVAEKMLTEVKLRHAAINKKKLVSEQNKLTRKIKKLASEKAFNNFVPSYKDLASIAQIFNDKIPVKSKILLEGEIVEKMSSQKLTEGMVPIDNLVYKSFIKRFNQEYSEKLLPTQKELLNKFVTSFHNNGLELKNYLNEEVGRLKKELQMSFGKDEIMSDSQMTENAQKVIDILDSCKERKPDKQMVEEIIKIQALAEELKEDGDQN
jgi:hypothetical protein|tara:strand:- start:2123 stop:2956 length:834 start_codon:yes stop_codon:yes gene_type:complete